MVKFRLYRSYFGNISFIMVDNYICASTGLIQLIDIFNPQNLIISITALDQNSEFFKFVYNEKERFRIILPINNTITAETTVMSNTGDFLSVFDLLMESEPRCITLYESKDNIEIDYLYRGFRNYDEILLRKAIIKYAVAIIVEECSVQITFNTNLYDPVNLFKTIKKNLKEL